MELAKESIEAPSPLHLMLTRAESLVAEHRYGDAYRLLMNAVEDHAGRGRHREMSHEPVVLLRSISDLDTGS